MGKKDMKQFMEMISFFGRFSETERLFSEYMCVTLEVLSHYFLSASKRNHQKNRF